MDTPLVQITAVLQSRPSDLLLGAELERPTSGSAFDRTTFEVSGWVVGRNAPAREVQLVSRGRVLRTIPVSAERPDIVVQLPEAPERSGFWMLAGTLGLDRTFEVEVKAVLDDGSHATIGSIHGRRSPVSTSFDPKLAPLMLTSLGRTGTTLAMSLLSAHPRIVAHRTYPYEIFPAKYWLHLLRVLAEPADHASFQPEGFTDDLWKVGYNPFHSPPVTNDPELMQLLGKTYVERLARFCEASIDDLYLAIAASQGQDSASFFLEKFQPGHIPSLAWDLYPEAKEVFLVRDFRDVICSVFAFNEKRGNVGFGRDQCASDEDYVRYVARGAEQLLHDWRQRRDLGHLVRYEDLAAQPEETTAAVLEYVGLPRSPETIELMLRTALESPSFDKHRTSATVQESIGRWRHELPSDLRAVCREALDPVLTELGYEPTDGPARGQPRPATEPVPAPTDDAPERFDPEVMHGRLIEAEHLARYWWAAALVPGKRVLDAGCGTAYGAEILARAGATALVGIDLDARVVEAARATATENVTLEVADVRALPFEDGSFDVAVCFEVIEHVDQPERVLDELRRVLRDDGLLLVSSPNRAVYPPGNPHHKHEFLPQELADALSQRFQHVRLVRQQDWLGSGILDDVHYASDGGRAFDAVVRKAVRADPGNELYTLALASQIELPAAPPYVVLTETADAKWWQTQVDRAQDERDAVEKELGDVVDVLAERDSQLRHAHEAIRTMEATRIWRWGTSYWSLRDRLLRRN